VLSFDITHRLTDLLIAIETATHHHGPVLPGPTVVLAAPRGGTPWLYCERMPVPGHAWHTQPGGATGDREAQDPPTRAAFADFLAATHTG
jgi:hypothetical protein